MESSETIVHLCFQMQIVRVTDMSDQIWSPTTAKRPLLTLICTIAACPTPCLLQRIVFYFSLGQKTDLMSDHRGSHKELRTALCANGNIWKPPLGAAICLLSILKPLSVPNSRIFHSNLEQKTCLMTVCGLSPQVVSPA